MLCGFQSVLMTILTYFSAGSTEKGKTNILGKDVSFVPDPEQISGSFLLKKKKKKKTTHKVSRNQNHMWTKGAESGHQKKSAVLTTRSISLDTFFHHSVCFQENDRR